MTAAALIILLLILLAWGVYLLRDPHRLARIAGWVLHLRYRVTFEGLEPFMQCPTALLMPNHPSYIDPVLLAAEVWGRGKEIAPMSDEKFKKKPIINYVFTSCGVVWVPDLHVTRARDAVLQAQKLVDLCVEALAAGKSMAFYPSGHVTLDGVETIGARRMGYQVTSAIANAPDGTTLRNVRIFMIRIRGAETSHWAKSRRVLLDQNGHIAGSLPFPFTHPKWYQRRHIVFHLEDMTDTLLEWAETGNKAEFNKHLEDWYNA